MNYPDLMKIVKRLNVDSDVFVNPINSSLFLDSSFVIIRIGSYGSFTFYITKHKKVCEGFYDGYDIKMEKQISSYDIDILPIELTKKPVYFSTRSVDEIVKKINRKLKKVNEYKKILNKPGGKK